MRTYDTTFYSILSYLYKLASAKAFDDPYDREEYTAFDTWGSNVDDAYEGGRYHGELATRSEIGTEVRRLLTDRRVHELSLPPTERHVYPAGVTLQFTINSTESDAIYNHMCVRTLRECNLPKLVQEYTSKSGCDVWSFPAWLVVEKYAVIESGVEVYLGTYGQFSEDLRTADTAAVSLKS